MSSKSKEKTQTPVAAALTNTCWIEDRRPFFTAERQIQSSLSKQNTCYLSQLIPRVETNSNKNLAYEANTVIPVPPVKAEYGMTRLTINMLYSFLYTLHNSKAKVHTLPQAKSLTLSPSIDRFKGGEYPNQDFYSI